MVIVLVEVESRTKLWTLKLDQKKFGDVGSSQLGSEASCI